MEFIFRADFALQVVDALKRREPLPTPTRFEDVIALASAAIHESVIRLGSSEARRTGHDNQSELEKLAGAAKIVIGLAVYQFAMLSDLEAAPREATPYELRGEVRLDQPTTIDAYRVALDRVSRAAMDRVSEY